MSESIRTAEVVGALSIATDLGTGQPLEHALRSAVLAVRLGELAGASAAGALGHVLRRAAPRRGLHVERARGDAAVRRGHRAPGRLLPRRHHQSARRSWRSTTPTSAPGRSPGGARDLIEDGAREPPERARDSFAAMCEVAQRFAGWLGLGADVHAALEYVFARWDGKGLPGRRRRRDPVADAPAARGAGHLALPLGRGPGRGAWRHRASQGRRVRPAARRARHAELRRPARGPGRGADVGAGARERAGPLVASPGDRIDDAFGAFAAIAGLKSPWLREHSTASPSSPRRPPGAWASARTPSRSCGAARSRRTWAASACRTRSGRSRAARVRGVGAGAAAPALHRACLRAVGGAGADRAARRLAPRTARRLRLSPRHARAGARSARPHPRRGRLLRRHARGAAAPAGARRRCRGGGAAARGRARDGSPRTPSTRCSTPAATACRSDRASCRPG